MKSKKQLAILLVFLFLSQNVLAYLDPGTGSYLLQLIIAFFIGGLFSLKLFWGRIKTKLKDLLAPKKKT